MNLRITMIKTIMTIKQKYSNNENNKKTCYLPDSSFISNCNYDDKNNYNNKDNNNND